MSEADKNADKDADGNAAPAKPKGKKKLMIIAGAAVLVLGGGGGGAWFMLRPAPAAEAKGEAEHAEEPAKEEGGEGGEKGEAFLDVPPLVVNLRSADGAPRFLKVHLMLVPGPKGSSEKLKEKLPVLLDAYQPFLRELRPEDLNGSAAVYRVKEEMLIRATGALGPDMVEDVLIQDLIQQ